MTCFNVPATQARAIHVDLMQTDVQARQDPLPARRSTLMARFTGSGRSRLRAADHFPQLVARHDPDRGEALCDVVMQILMLLQ